MRLSLSLLILGATATNADFYPGAVDWSLGLPAGCYIADGSFDYESAQVSGEAPHADTAGHYQVACLVGGPNLVQEDEALSSVQCCPAGGAVCTLAYTQSYSVATSVSTEVSAQVSAGIKGLGSATLGISVTLGETVTRTVAVGNSFSFHPGQQSQVVVRKLSQVLYFDVYERYFSQPFLFTNDINYDSQWYLHTPSVAVTVPLPQSDDVVTANTVAAGIDCGVTDGVDVCAKCDSCQCDENCDCLPDAPVTNPCDKCLTCECDANCECIVQNPCDKCQFCQCDDNCECKHSLRRARAIGGIMSHT